MGQELYDACGRWLASYARIHRLLAQVDLRSEPPCARKQLRTARGLIRALEELFEDVQLDHTPREDNLPTKEECVAELWALMSPHLQRLGLPGRGRDESS